MGKIYCKYHRALPAHWYCLGCDLNFCDNCAVKREESQYTKKTVYHLCPKCNESLDWLGPSNIIDPFWHRLSHFFAYPFAMHPMFLIIALAMVTTFLKTTYMGGGLLSFLFWAMMLKYAFAAMRETARGNMKPPDVNADTIMEDLGEVVKQIGIYAVLIFLGFWIGGKFGLAAVVIYIAIAVLFLPSMIILLVATGSIIHSLNPMLFVSLVFRIGKGYFIMYFFLLLLGSAPAYIIPHFMTFLPKWLSLLLTGITKNYYLLVSYHMMGYVLLQYHDEIGYSVDYEEFNYSEAPAAGKAAASIGAAVGSAAIAARGKTKTPESPVLNRVGQFIQDGQYEEALNHIRQETRETGITDPVLKERYFELLKIRKEKEEMLKVGGELLDQYAKANDGEKAGKIYAACQAADPAFTPEKKLLLKLGGWLKDSNPKAAINAYNRYAKAYPKDAMVPTAYFRAAQVFHEKLGNRDKAIQILTAITKKYPNHEIVSFVENYMRTM